MLFRQSGSINPDVYIIMDTPSTEDIIYNEVGSSEDARVLAEKFTSRGLQVRIGAVNIEGEINYNTEGFSTRATFVVQDELRIRNLQRLASDIVGTKPKILVPVGVRATQAILNDNTISLAKVIHSIRPLVLGGVHVNVVPMYSPRYAEDNFSAKTSIEVNCNKVEQLVRGTYRDITEDLEVHHVTTYDDMVKFYNDHLQDDSVLVLDYESNARGTRMFDYDISGFSLANRGNTEDHKLRGVYVVLNSLEYDMPIEEKKRCIEFLRHEVETVSERSGRSSFHNYESLVEDKMHTDPDTKKLETRGLDGKVHVHNLMYEVPATVNALDYEIPFEDIDDSLVMSKMLNGGSTGAGLKYQAQLLGYPEWEHNLHAYIGLFKDIANSGMYRGKPVATYEFVLDGNYEFLQYTNRADLIKNYGEDLGNVLSEVPKMKLLKGHNEALQNYWDNGITEDNVPMLFGLVDGLLNYSGKSPAEVSKMEKRLGTVSLEHINPYMTALEKPLKYVPTMNGPRDLTITDSIRKMVKLLLEYYTMEEISTVLFPKLSEKLNTLRELPDGYYGNIIPYGWIPLRVISEYGAMDAVASYHVRHELIRRMINESTSEVNLFGGYEVYLMQHYLGYEMEQSGLKWDEESARSKEIHLVKMATNSLAEIITNDDDVTKEYLYNKTKHIHLPKVLLGTALGDYIKKHFNREFIEVGNGYKLEVFEDRYDEANEELVQVSIGKVNPGFMLTGGQTAKITVDPIEEDLRVNHPDVFNRLRDEVMECIEDDVSTKTHYEELKGYINPGSTSGADFEQYKKLADHHIMTENFKKLHTVRMLSDALAIMDKGSGDYVKYSEYIHEFNEYWNYRSDFEDDSDEEKTKYIRENHLQLRKDNFPRIMEMVDNLREEVGNYIFTAELDWKGKPVSPKSVADIVNYCRYLELPGLSDEWMIWMYNTMRWFPINTEDPESWVPDGFPEVKWMYNLRIYKKCTKLISSYIDGKTGRKEVYTVKTEDLQSGTRRLLRYRPYHTLEHDENGDVILEPGESLLLQGTFSVCGAETGRWKAGLHTLPSNSDVKTMYTSRFKGGTIAQPDFCLVGSTVIKLADGRDIMLKDLYLELGAEINEEFYVHSWNIEKQRPEVSLARGLHVTKLVNETYRITLDNGHVIESTENHPFLIKDTQEYVRADELEVGMSLQPMNYKKPSSGYLQFSGSNTDYEFIHRSTGAKFYPEEYDECRTKREASVHHINKNILNNHPHNLEIHTAGSHISHHWENDPEFRDAVTEGARKSMIHRRSTNMNNINEVQREAQRKYIQDRWDNHHEEEMEIRKKAGQSERKANIDNLIAVATHIHRSGTVVSPFFWDAIVESMSITLKDDVSIKRAYKYRYLYDNNLKVSELMVLAGAPTEYVSEVEFREMIEDSITSQQPMSKKNGQVINKGKGFIKKLRMIYDYFDGNHVYIDWQNWDYLVETYVKTNPKMMEMLSGSGKVPTGRAIGNAMVGTKLSTIEKYFKDESEFRRYMKVNHRVVKIEVVKHEIPVPVYDLEVPDNHNFVIATGDMSGIITSNSQNEVRALATSAMIEAMLQSFANDEDIHMENAKRIYQKEEVSDMERRYAKTATFHMLYGGDEASFANEYLNGDVALAKTIFDAFIYAFPEIKAWKDARLEEAKTMGKVSLMTNRFINLHIPDQATDRKGYEEAVRQSGNYPIQGASSDAAACTGFAISQEAKALGMLSTYFLFIHDSLESDIHPYEFIEMVKIQQRILASYPLEKFGMYCKAEMSFGYSLGHEIELIDIQSNDAMDEATLLVSGYRDEMEDTFQNWKLAYHEVEVLEEDLKDEYIPMHELFILKHAYNPKICTTRQRGKVKVRIKYYDN